MHKLFLEMLEASLGSGAITFGPGVNIGASAAASGAVGGAATATAATTATASGVLGGGIGVGHHGNLSESVGGSLGLINLMPIHEATLQTNQVLQ